MTFSFKAQKIFVQHYKINYKELQVEVRLIGTWFEQNLSSERLLKPSSKYLTYQKEISVVYQQRIDNLPNIFFQWNLRANQVEASTLVVNDVTQMLNVFSIHITGINFNTLNEADSNKEFETLVFEKNFINMTNESKSY